VSLVLEGYGEADASRAALKKRFVLGVLGLAIAGAALYYVFRDYREQSRVTEFVDHLRARRYAAAYGQWGCTVEQPCRDYSYERFLEDWGPKSVAADVTNVRIGPKRSCPDSVIQTLELGGKEQVLLLVDRSSGTLGFSPWPVCRPRPSVRSSGVQ
jgi:hypothetical protein